MEAGEGAVCAPFPKSATDAITFPDAKTTPLRKTTVQ